jgi:Tol biopolymer transport system component
LAYVWKGKQLWVMNADGRNAKQFFASSDDIVGLTWSPEGGHFAYRALKVSSSQTYVVDAAGGEAWPVVPEQEVGLFAWHPSSGELLVVLWSGKGEGLTSELRLVDMDQRQRLLWTQRGRILGAPAWSPDGSRVVFCADSDAGTDLWQLELEGLALSRLTQDGQAYGSAAWSPDGTQLAYTIRESGAVSPDRAEVMDFRTGEKREIFSRSGVGTISWISWCPSIDHPHP